MQRKHIALLLLLFFAVFVAGPAGAALDYERFKEGVLEHFNLTKKGTPLPDVTFLNEQGKPVQLSAFRGRTTLLMIWATWCPYCRMDMPHMESLQAKLGGGSFTVLPVSVDSKGVSVVRSYFSSNKFTQLRIYSDPESKISEALDTGGLPFFILIDAGGREIGRIAGETNWLEPEAQTLLQAAITGQ